MYIICNGKGNSLARLICYTILTINYMIHTLAMFKTGPVPDQVVL
jgi:hypothetical protein